MRPCAYHGQTLNEGKFDEALPSFRRCRIHDFCHSARLRSSISRAETNAGAEFANAQDDGSGTEGKDARRATQVHGRAHENDEAANGWHAGYDGPERNDGAQTGRGRHAFAYEDDAAALEHDGPDDGAHDGAAAAYDAPRKIAPSRLSSSNLRHRGVSTIRIATG